MHLWFWRTKRVEHSLEWVLWSGFCKKEKYQWSRYRWYWPCIYSVLLRHVSILCTANSACFPISALHLLIYKISINVIFCCILIKSLSAHEDHMIVCVWGKVQHEVVQVKNKLNKLEGSENDGCEQWASNEQGVKRWSAPSGITLLLCDTWLSAEWDDRRVPSLKNISWENPPILSSKNLQVNPLCDCSAQTD